MSRFNIPLVTEGLTTYAMERQNGWEHHQPDGAPTWMEQRRFWTDAILQGMAKLDGQIPDPRLMEQFDHELEQARSCSSITPASPQLQKKTILDLRRYVSSLEAAGDDRRRQVKAVQELLRDMSSHLPWANGHNNLQLALDEVETMLRRMTAQMPICFTRILLGGDAGPHWASGYVSGAVTDAEAVRKTKLYQEIVRDFPEVTSWHALCMVYVGHDLPSAYGTVDASDFDLEIMNHAGEQFLKEPGVRWMSGSYQMTIPVAPVEATPEKAQIE